MSRVSGTGSSRSGSLSRGTSSTDKTSKGGKVGASSKTSLSANVNLHTSPFLDKLMEVEMSFVKEELEAALRDIEHLGKELVRNPNIQNLKSYKAKVQAFLKQALKKIYKVDNKLGLKRLGVDHKVFVSVEKIDEELEELTIKFMNDQEEALGVIAMVEGIQGLLCNIIA